MPFAVPAAAWAVFSRPSAGFGVVGLAGNHTVPSGAGAIPDPAL
jgi:hypothetical protein